MYWGWQLRSMEQSRQPLASGHSWVQREDLKLGPRHVCRCPCRLVLPIHPWFTSSFPREDILQSKVLGCSSPPFTFFPPTRGGSPPCCLWSLSFPRTQWNGFNLYSLSHFLSTSASSIEIDPVFSPHLQISSNPTSIPSSSLSFAILLEFQSQTFCKIWLFNLITSSSWWYSSFKGGWMLGFWKKQC